jgi:hypothetical protein
MEAAKLVLEYVKVILSAHVIFGGIAAFFIVFFRKELGGLIGRVLNIKFPGGELSMSQSEKTTAELSAPKEHPAVPDSEKPALPQNLSLTPDQAKAIQELIQSQRADAYLWEYRYLNYYLVPNTQHVLDYLVSFDQRVSVKLYDSVWSQAIPRAEERLAIINALQQHHLIVLNGDLIEVTPKGKEYVGWRGPSR